MDQNLLSCDHCTYMNPELCKRNGFINEYGICKNVRPDNAIVDAITHDVEHIDELPKNLQEQYRSALNIVAGLVDTFTDKNIKL